MLNPVNISGHSAGTQVAVTLGKILRSNRKLLCLYWDDNGTTSVGFKMFKNGLKYNNGTLVFSPVPLNDFANAIKTDPNPKAFKQIQKSVLRIEQLLSQSRYGERSPSSPTKNHGVRASVARIELHDLTDYDSMLQAIVTNRELGLFFREFAHKHFNNEVSHYHTIDLPELCILVGD